MIDKDLLSRRRFLQASLASGLLLGLLVGVPFGVISAVYQGSLIDHLVRVFSVVLNALPNFWLGLVLALAISINLGWLPAVGYKGFSHDHRRSRWLD